MGGSRMMPAFMVLALGISLILFLVLLVRRGDLQPQTNVSSRDRTLRDHPLALQPRELALRIFSPQDREFIFLMHSPRLLAIYQKERRRVALHWVHQLSREVSEIMRTHRLTSRQSPDLNVATEANLFLEYLKLQFLCGLLMLLIQVLGPHSLNDLAAYAGELYQRIGQALPETPVPSRLAPSQNSAAP
jgi:hypothetical protein